MENNGQRTLFITGATGLVGSEILCRLAASRDIRIYILIRANNREELRQRFDTLLHNLALDPSGSYSVFPVSGDISIPGLGFDPLIHDQLSEEVTDIVHCASDISFGRSISEARNVNLLGTVNLMELVSRWRHVRQIAHFSTVQVAGKRTGLILEDELFHSLGFINSYEQSKYETEVYLRGLMGDLPIAIYRVSGITGEARSGCVRQFNWLHHLLRLLSKDLLPMLPGDPNLHVDLVPIDWLVEVFWHIFSERYEPGRTFHLAAGERNSLTIRELVELSHQCLVTSPYTHSRNVRIPRIIDREILAEMLNQSDLTGKNLEVRQLNNLMGDFIPQWYLSKIYDLSNFNKALDGWSYQLPEIWDYFPKIIDYCLVSNWGRVKPGHRIVQERC